MYLNTLVPAIGSKKNALRVGRGIGSGLGKTAGRGHKGQKARSGGYHKINFEGGQMPIQRRLPKMGFKSQKSKSRDELNLSYVATLGLEEISLDILRSLDIIQHKIKKVKLIGTAEIKQPITVTSAHVRRELLLR